MAQGEILRTLLIKKILLISCVIAIILPLVNIFVIFPSFTGLVVKNAERETAKIAHHLSHLFLTDDGRLKAIAENRQRIAKVIQDLDIMKIKVFSRDGKIIYSTDPSDTGTLNRKDYFTDIVGRGIVYTKVVKKNSTTLENQVMSSDVVETYIPIMLNNEFRGAFEIYYDITEENGRLNDLAIRISIIPLALIFCFIAAIIFLLSRGGRYVDQIETNQLPVRLRSPFYMLAFVTVSIFAVEYFVMMVLNYFPMISFINLALFDSIMLVILISPTLYFFLLRPLLTQIKELKRSEERTYRIAYYDKLTKLPNRELFHDRVAHMIAYSERHELKFAVLLFDLDDFKRINDSFGHRTGDGLLRKVSVRLSRCLRSTDSIYNAATDRGRPSVARLGGDEFTVLLSCIKEFDDAAKVARRIIHVLSEPFKLNDMEIYVTMSMGIAIYPHDGRDIDTIMKNADTAMNYAKEKGKNNYQYYRESMNTTILRKLSIEAELRRALDHNEFVLFYQPQVDALTGKTSGVEALVRWMHPSRGMIPPLEFIPVAEETGLIVPLTDLVIEMACRHSVIWQNKGYDPLTVSVNLSSHQFQQSNFIKVITDILEKTGVSKDNIMLEITESTLMEETETSVMNLHELTNKGLRLIIDDFGTGYSSLSYLKRFQIYAIKIDRTFVKEITSNLEDAALADAIISVAHALNMQVIAEGVETEQQMNHLIRQGCDKLQGYLFSRPLPADELEEFLASSSRMSTFTPNALHDSSFPLINP